MSDYIPNYVKTVLKDDSLKTIDQYNLIFDFFWNNGETEFCKFLSSLKKYHLNRILAKLS